jgi:hypothetical protein
VLSGRGTWTQKKYLLGLTFTKKDFSPYESTEEWWLIQEEEMQLLEKQIRKQGRLISHGLEYFQDEEIL